MHIFDVWVFNPFAQSCRNILLGQCYRHNELEKWRSYDERVREVEHDTFSPLVFFTAGGRGNTATVVYKRIASLIAGKQTKPYNKTLHRLRCRLSFSLLRSVVMCLRGSRPLVPNPAFHPLPPWRWPVLRSGSQLIFKNTACKATLIYCVL